MQGDLPGIQNDSALPLSVHSGELVFKKEAAVFRNFFRKKTEDALRKASMQHSHAVNSDVCKRAVGLFPDSSERPQDPKDTGALRFHHLLISLEGAERTGCLKISSHQNRSRSALLLFRGRVVGAVYGRKYMRGQYLHEDAHKCALSELAAPGNMLDAYELPEDLVLAASSLFYGETLDTNYGQNLETTFEYALSSLQRSNMPGCVVVNSSGEETICIVYIAQGRIVGVFTASEGWTKGPTESLKRSLKAGNCKVHASILPIPDPRRVGFSLTGLGPKGIGARVDATPYQDFTPPPAPSAVVRTPAREAVAQAVRQHRNTGEMSVASRDTRSYARV